MKGEGYRLYVNGPMMKGADVKVGQTATFQIEQSMRRKKPIPMLNALKQKLEENSLVAAFKKLTPSRQKEILKYLGFLKSEEARERNIEKIIKGLKGEEASSLFRLP
ncbi:MAG TPA: YdeI/OmpD-associated family protein [Saprospiraceae bacterium]|nr:YdeI/OmpD-associated family protein [Saprospiraceae bacterium]